MGAVVDLSFLCTWKAEILDIRPLILPPRHYVYPLEAEEVERGALEVLVRPNFRPTAVQAQVSESRPGAPGSSDLRPFLATCALGFRDPNVPSGVWSAPNPSEICAVSGGYAYVINTIAPERFTMIPYRPVLEIRTAPVEQLLLFIGHYRILAWGWHGQAWESDKLSAEGITVTAIETGRLRGMGWDLMSDKETPFVLDLRTGKSLPLDMHS